MFQNNSSEMKNVVESFFIEETIELIYDNEQLDKYNALREQLGIKGNKIQSKGKSPLPFLHMKSSLQNILGTLCPVSVDFKEYNITPIPVEILELIALSVREKYFSKIEIWYDNKSPDPVCVGVGPSWYIDNREGGGKYDSGLVFHTQQECQEYIDSNSLSDKCRPYNYSWSAEKYLIGKWGDVKHSFSELKDMAKARFMELEGASLRKQIKDSQRSLDDLEITATERFGAI